MSPLPAHLRNFGVTTVAVVHHVGAEDERRFEVEAHIQSKTGFFAVDTPIYEGDVVEFPDPRGGVTRRLAASVDVNNPTGPSFRGMEHINVTWGTAPPERPVHVRRLSIENLHPQVLSAASALFADGHYEASVSEAFKSIEIRVRTMTDSSQSGVRLMGEAFGGPEPRLSIAKAVGQSGRDEQEGFAAPCLGFEIQGRMTSSVPETLSRRWSTLASPACFIVSSTVPRSPKGDGVT